MKIAKLSTLIFLYGYFFIPNMSLAQVPENDLCINADSLLTVVDSCAFTNFSLFQATVTEENFCDEHSEVWFKFLYNTPNKVRIHLEVSAIFQTVQLSMNVYRGDCTNLELIACDIQSPNELFYTFFNPDLMGQMIYLAVNDKFFTSTQLELTHSICREEESQDLDHFDVCSIAKQINFNPTEVCTYSYDVIISENTYSGLTTNCNDGKEEKDQWSKFTLPADGRVVLDMEIFSNPNFISVESIAFYKGTCTALELITCFKPDGLVLHERYLFQNLANEEIFMQVVTTMQGTLVYHLCLKGELGAPHPPYDDCTTALMLPVHQETCEEAFIANNVNAFNSLVNSDCPGFNGLDVWFTLDMPPSGKVLIETESLIQSPLTDGVMAVYWGTCEELVFIACDDDSGMVNMPAISLNDESLANKTIYIQFWSFNGIDQGDFSICVFEPNAPVGDICQEAIQVSPSLEQACYLEDAPNNSLVSNASSAVSPPCNDLINKDIWFQFSYSVGQPLVFEFSKLDNSLLVDGKAAIYRGACDDLIFISCDDDSGPGVMPSFDLQEIIEADWDEDQDFYIQFWDFEQGVGGNFSYCLYEKMSTNIFELNELSIVIVPNPTNAGVHISMAQNFNMDIKWRLMNIDGKLIKKGAIAGFDAERGFDIDTEGLSASTYLISIQSLEYHWVERFIKL